MILIRTLWSYFNYITKFQDHGSLFDFITKSSIFKIKFQLISVYFDFLLCDIYNIIYQSLATNIIFYFFISLTKRLPPTEPLLFDKAFFLMSNFTKLYCNCYSFIFQIDIITQRQIIICVKWVDKISILINNRIIWK